MSAVSNPVVAPRTRANTTAIVARTGNGPRRHRGRVSTNVDHPDSEPAADVPKLDDVAGSRAMRLRCAFVRCRYDARTADPAVATMLATTAPTTVPVRSNLVDRTAAPAAATALARTCTTLTCDRGRWGAMVAVVLPWGGLS